MTFLSWRSRRFLSSVITEFFTESRSAFSFSAWLSSWSSPGEASQRVRISCRVQSNPSMNIHDTRPLLSLPSSPHPVKIELKLLHILCMNITQLLDTESAVDILSQASQWFLRHLSFHSSFQRECKEYLAGAVESLESIFCWCFCKYLDR